MEARQLDITFTSKDLYNKLGVPASVKAFDASTILDELREREQERGLFFRFTQDEDGCLDKLFLVMDGAAELYAADVENNIVVFDTKVRTCFLRTYSFTLSCHVCREISAARSSTCCGRHVSLSWAALFRLTTAPLPPPASTALTGTA